MGGTRSINSILKDDVIPIPPVPGEDPTGFFSAIKESLEIGTGQRGDVLDQFVTVRDLTNSELITYLNDQEVSVTRPKPAVQSGNVPEPPYNLMTLKTNDNNRLNAFNHVLTWENPGSVVYGSNLVNNSSFETGDPPSGWTAGLSADLDRYADSFVGTYCLEINENGEENPFAYQSHTVTAGATYRYTFYVKQGTEASWQSYVYDMDNSTNLSSSQGFEYYGEATSEFVKYTHIIKIPSNCTTVRLALQQMCSASSGTTILYDNIIFQERIISPIINTEDYSHIEIWCAESNYRSKATLLGIVTYPGDMYTHIAPDPTKDYYYWIRMVNWAGQYSTWEPDEGQGGYVVQGIDTIGETIDKLIAALKGEEPDAYSAVTEYTAGDLVSYTVGDDTRRYRCTATTTGNLPTDTDYWERIGILVEGEVDGVSCVGVDGNMVVDGTIITRNLDANCITADVIAASTITATQINGTSFGTLTISSGKIAINATDALEIQSSGNMKVVAGSDIELVGSDSDPGNVFFTGSSYAVRLGSNADGSEFYIAPTTTEATSIYIGTGSPWGSSYVADNVKIVASEEVEIRANIDGYPTTSSYTRLLTQANSTGSGLFIYARHEGTAKSLNVSHTDSLLEFAPAEDKDWNLGKSDAAWDDAYADDWNNVADFYNLDDRDDILAIRSIKGSGVIDSETGLELIDDDTIPSWMLKKHKKDTEEYNINGKIFPAHKAGEIIYTPDNKPYLSLKLLTSLLMGAVRQLDTKIIDIEKTILKLENVREK